MKSQVTYLRKVILHAVKNLPAMQGTQVWFLGQEDPLGKGMTTQSRVLAWRTQGQRSLVGYSPWSHKKLDKTEQLSTINAYSCVLSCSFVSNSLQPHGQPTRLLCRWDSLGKNTQVMNLLDYLHLKPSREKTVYQTHHFQTDHAFDYIWCFLLIMIIKRQTWFISVQVFFFPLIFNCLFSDLTE